MQHPHVPIPLAPMVDMVFLILVFFMCVSHLSDPAHAIDIDLPQAGVRASPLKEEAAIATVFILADGTVYYGGRAVDAEVLVDHFTHRAGDEAERRVRIKADRHTPWSVVHPVIDALTRAGTAHLLITSVEGGAGHEG